jgi:hypothetical protein
LKIQGVRPGNGTAAITANLYREGLKEAANPLWHLAPAIVGLAGHRVRSSAESELPIVQRTLLFQARR